MLTTTFAELCEWLWEAFKEAQVQSMTEAERQKLYYDRKANAISLEPGDLVLAKADTYKGKRKVKDQCEEELYAVEYQVAGRHPFLPCEKPADGMLMGPPLKLTFSHHSHKGDPLCMVVWTEWARCATTTLEEQTLKMRDETGGNATKCELSAPGPAPDR